MSDCASSTVQVNAYAGYSCDGEEEILVCDGVQHYALTERPDFEDSPVVSSGIPCNGTCRSQDHSERLAEQIRELKEQRFYNDGSEYRNRVTVSRQVKNLISTQSLHGRVIYSWYIKRTSKGDVYLLDNGLLVQVDISMAQGEGSRVKVNVIPDGHLYASMGIDPEVIARVPELFAAAMEWQARMNARD